MPTIWLSKHVKQSDIITDADFRVLPEKRRTEIIERYKEKLIPVIEYLWGKIGRLKTSCCYRNDEHNREVEGKPNSHHRCFEDKCAWDGTPREVSTARAFEVLKEIRKEFCYAYWDRAKNFIHISGRTEHDKLKRVGAMWIVEEDGKHTYV